MYFHKQRLTQFKTDYMNFLAHIYLSGDNDYIKIGNFMADGIKGDNYNNYPNAIKKGILLHRAIDSFTDMHPIFRKSKHRLHEKYGHYSGVIMDIFYDHFLAKNWSDYSDITLEDFSNDFYNLLWNNFDVLPVSSQRMVPFLVDEKWLQSYAQIDGIEKVLIGMNKRTNNRSKMHLAISDLNKHYDAFEKDFTLFFEDIMVFAEEQLQLITTPI